MNDNPIPAVVAGIRRAMDALERFANDTLAGRNSAHELRELLAAAPAVQGEPVGRVKTVGGYPDESEHLVEWLCKYKDLKDGDLLYTAPQPAEQQPAPDVAELVEALEEIDAWVSRWCADDHPVAKSARNALAAYRQEGEK